MELVVGAGAGAGAYLRPRCRQPSLTTSLTIKSFPRAQQQNSSQLPSFQFQTLLSSSHRNRQLIVSAVKSETDRFLTDIMVTETKQPHSSVRLGIEVPRAICKECYNKVLHEFSKQAKVPGFRPGKKVPDNILINYIGKQTVEHAVIEAMLRKTLPRAMTSVEGRALKDSVRIVTNFAEMYDKFSLEDSFRYDVVVDVAPEIKWLTETKYKNLNVFVQIDKTITAEIASEVELRRLHKSLGSLRLVTDRGLQIGDLVVLDVFATRIEDDASQNEKIPSAERKGFHLDTEESGNLLPGFLNSIIGIKQGETKSFLFQFPETWEQVNLQGVQAQFTDMDSQGGRKGSDQRKDKGKEKVGVECKELFYRDLPELDDSLAENLLPGSSSLNQVRESLLQRCKEVEQIAIEQATDNAILEQLSKIVEVVVPQSLFEEQGRQLYGAKLLQLQVERKLSGQQLESLSSEKAVNEYLENQKENIRSIIIQKLVVGEIFQSENLQYSTDELVKEVENSVEEFKRHDQEYDEERVKQQVQDVLEGAEVLQWLRENSNVQCVFK